MTMSKFAQRQAFARITVLEVKVAALEERVARLEVGGTSTTPDPITLDEARMEKGANT